jgi:hypothetical protein
MGMMEGVNLNTMYCKNFCKFADVTMYPSTTKILKKKKEKENRTMKPVKIVLRRGRENDGGVKSN